MSRVRRALAAVGGSAALLAALGGAVSHYAGRITERPALLTSRPRPHDRVTVVEVDAETVTLSGEGAARPGVWGLTWPSGDAYGRVGPVIERTGQHVRRSFQPLRGQPTAGTSAVLETVTTPPDPTLLNRVHEWTEYPSPLGPSPAILFPADGPTWVVAVHGRSGRYHEAFRLVPGLVDAGVPVLTISYRDDPDGPASADGYSHLGATEWEDVAAAVAWACERGARDVVLLGYSMGGGIALTALARDQGTAQRVRGLVLDAPVLAWGPVLRAAAVERGLPPAVLPLLLPASMALAGRQAGIGWRALAHDHDSLAHPTLLVHGTADLTVPVELADALAAARPDLVTYLRVEGAGHGRAWNHDPHGYEAALRAFLGGIGALA